MEIDSAGELEYEMYIVEAILDKSADGKKYLVKWESWTDHTWEPIENHVSDTYLFPLPRITLTLPSEPSHSRPPVREEPEGGPHSHSNSDPNREEEQGPTVQEGGLGNPLLRHVFHHPGERCECRDQAGQADEEA